MAEDCLGCVCQSACTTGSSGRLLLATQVAHTSKALRSLASSQGLKWELLAPGLLAVETDHADVVISEACRELSSVEADEVRCVVLDEPARSEAGLIARAMSAPTLSSAGARVIRADLLPLFEDERRHFRSEYQPIVTLADRRTIGYEALLRAEGSDGRPIMPDELFPAAEAAGWIHLLDRVGRTTALRDAGGWLADQMLFINFIPTSIYRPEVCLRTTELAASRAGVQLDQLVFEVTEGHKVHDVDHLERVFDYYRSRHCKVALDDLGSGYSSLNLLVRLRPDIVKLDKELVQGLPGAPSRAVVAAVVDITHSYGGLVLAECVETLEQSDEALQLGVDLAQGWLYGRPERRTSTLPEAVPVAGRQVVGSDPTRPDPAVAIAPDDPPAAPEEETTGLADRGRLVAFLQTAQQRAASSQRAVVVLAVHLDGLNVTDSISGRAYRKLLAEVAARLRAVVRAGDLVARVGDDEFVAVLADVDPLDTARVAGRAAGDILADMQRPLTSGSAQTALSGSVGVSIFPDCAPSCDGLLASAIAAMGAATRSGDGAVRYASPRSSGRGSEVASRTVTKH